MVGSYREINESVGQVAHNIQQQSSELLGQAESLRGAMERLQDLERLKDSFLSALFHEIRTPLACIQAYAEIMKTYEELDGEEKREFLAIILQECERLVRMLNDLLDLNRLESGCSPMQIEVLDASEVARNAVRTVDPFARRSNLSIDDRIGQSIWVHADRDRLMQVFVNLLTNAIKFTPSGGTITIEAECIVGDMVELRVIDSGPGIPPEKLVRLFTRYTQLQNQGLSLDTPGMGLGLSICREIITRQDGEIGARSEEGRGSEFWFRLPAATEPAAVPD